MEKVTRTKPRSDDLMSQTFQYKNQVYQPPSFLPAVNRPPQKHSPTSKRQSILSNTAPIPSSSHNAISNMLFDTTNRRVVFNFRWSPKFAFDKTLSVDSSGGGSGGECDGSPATVVQSGADEVQETAKSLASSSHRSKSFSSNKSVAGSQATISAQHLIKPLPDIR